MGAYLSEPVKEKATEEGEAGGLRWAATSMQGWRVNQEDAHNLITDLDGQGASLFAVYDGHGGSEVSEYVAKHFPDFLKASKLWAAGDVGEALKQAFLDFDARLLSAEALAELRQLAGQEAEQEELNEPDETAEERRMLFEEANMPIHQLVSKYGLPQQLVNNLTKALEDGAAAKGSSPDDDASPDGKLAKRKSNGDAGNDVKRCKTDGSPAKGELPKSPIGSPHRQRNSKSESELRVLKAEDEAAGPISNWKAMGVGGKGPDGKGEGGAEGGGRGTPETATAASSGDDEEKADEEEEEDEDFAAPDAEDLDKDDDSTESSEEETGDEGSDEEADGAEDGDGPEGEEEISLPMGDSPGVDSGTTACVAVLKDGELVVANAGDSRCIVGRAGKAVELSQDHKPEDPEERARVEKAGGRITPDGRVNGGLNLSRALGDHFYKRTKGLPLAEQMISPLPDIRRHAVTAEDRFVLLACDGIWNSLDSQEVVDFVTERLDGGQSPRQVAEALCDACLAPDSSGDGTGCDNMTVLLLLLPH